MVIKMWLALMLTVLLVFPVSGAVPRDRLVEELNATDFSYKSTGGTRGTLAASDWNLWSNGYIETTSAIPNDAPETQATGSLHRLTISAYGSSAGDSANVLSWPVMRLTIDGKVLATQTVSSASVKNYVFDLPIRAGMRKFRIEFTNDAIINNADRNLFIRSLAVAGPPSPLALPTSVGSFQIQSISISAGMFPKNTDWFGTGTSCDVTKPGCRNIDFIKGVGGNNVTLTSICEVPANQSWCSPQINYNAEEASLRLAIRYARARGLGVTLKPFVLRNDSVLNGWTPPDPKVFFDSIEAMLMHHAQIAREEGVGLMTRQSQVLSTQLESWLSIMDSTLN